MDNAARTAEQARLLHTAYLNPQREGWRTADKPLTELFSPLQIGGISLSHRMVKSAAGSACDNAGLTEELLEYYVNLAKGGVELIYVERITAFEPGQDGTVAPEAVEFGRRLVRECQAHGAVLGYQWARSGRTENTMTADEIHAFQTVGVNVAKSVYNMGFRAIEMNAAGFNLGARFLSRFYNARTDAYGIGSFENRARFVTDWIRRVKDECPGMNVQILMDCLEENDNLANNANIFTMDNTVTVPHTKTLTVEEGIELAKEFERAGADSIHLRLGATGHHVTQFASDLYFILNGMEGATGFGTQYDFKRNWQGQLISDTSGAGLALNVAARYKAALRIPCGVVTYMDPAHAPDFFEQALEDGKADFYMMTRPLTVDTEYVNKLRAGRRDEIAPCTRCLHCHIMGNEANAREGYCRVNALTQRVMRPGGPASYALTPAAKAKKVMVIGGGPGGMEAARIAALRGHRVTLYEKKGSLGGLLVLAHAVKGPHENLLDLRSYLIRQCELAGVTVRTGVEVTREQIVSEAPDAVILATGGLRGELQIPGNAPVVAVERLLAAELGENVVIWGSNAQAFDAALWLTVHRKFVTIVSPEPAERFDAQQSQHAARMMLTALYGQGVQSYPNAGIKSAGDGRAVIVTETGVELTVPCDTVLNAADLLPNTGLVDGLTGVEVYKVGDCVRPFNIALAIRAGNDAGRAV